MHLSASSLSAWLRCNRYYALTRTHEPADEPEALVFGTQLHEVLEQYLPTRNVARALDYIDAHHAGPEAAIRRAELRALLAGYHTQWGEDALNTLQVELPFPAAACIGPYAIKGRIDAVVRDPLGRVWLMEHKTASGDIRPGAAYWQRLRLDIQVTLYMAAARSLGLKPAGVIYDVVSKAALGPLRATPEEDRRYLKRSTADGRKPGDLVKGQRFTDETPTEYEARLVEKLAGSLGFYFQRQEVVRLERELERGVEEIIELGRQMEASLARGVTVRNPGSCFLYGKECPFFGVCTGVTGLEDERYVERHRLG